MHLTGLFLGTLSLLPQSLWALPTGTSAPTYDEIADFWHSELNLTASPPPDLYTQATNGYSWACTTLEVAFSTRSIQRNDPQYEARRTVNW